MNAVNSTNQAETAAELQAQFDLHSERLARNTAERLIRQAADAMDYAAKRMTEAEDLVSKEIYFQILAEVFPQPDLAPPSAPKGATLADGLTCCPVVASPPLAAHAG